MSNGNLLWGPVNLKGCPPDLGAITASLLDADKLAGMADGGRWVQADGRAVPGTKYATYIGTHVPDLRGCFLRGKNYGRAGDDGNAASDLELGSHQRHELRSHAHPFMEMVLQNPVDGIDSATVESSEHRTGAGPTAAMGDPETRPANVTVNYFICIN